MSILRACSVSVICSRLFRMYKYRGSSDPKNLRFVLHNFKNRVHDVPIQIVANNLSRKNVLILVPKYCAVTLESGPINNSRNNSRNII